MYTSIAVPAIGTGNLHIPHALVAKWMYDEADEFGRKYPNTRLHDIRYVVYDKDAKTVVVIAIAMSVFMTPYSLACICMICTEGLGDDIMLLALSLHHSDVKNMTMINVALCECTLHVKCVHLGCFSCFDS